MTPAPFRIYNLTWTILDKRAGVQDGQGVWHRDDDADVPTLDRDVFAAVRKHCNQGEAHMKERHVRQARESFIAAIKLLPEPLGQWNAAGWALLALGHAHVVTNDWQIARQVLSDAMWSPGVFGNPWAHRLKGQVHFALNERDRATDDLCRAYLMAGRDVFEGSGPECMALVEQVLTPPEGQETLP